MDNVLEYRLIQVGACTYIFFSHKDKHLYIDCYIIDYIDASYEKKHCSRSWTSTAQNLGRRKARLGRKERLSCAFFRPRTASCASVRNGLSCAFLRTERRYIGVKRKKFVCYLISDHYPSANPLNLTNTSR